MTTDYVKCADCGATRPREATKDGECIDRQWCANQQCASISESEAVREQVRAAVEAWSATALEQARAEEREACAAVVDGLASNTPPPFDVQLRGLAVAIRARGAQ